MRLFGSDFQNIIEQYFDRSRHRLNNILIQAKKNELATGEPGSNVLGGPVLFLSLPTAQYPSVGASCPVSNFSM